MKKTVVELFAGVGGFRVGLNNVTTIDKNGKAVENGDWEFVWASQWEPSTISQHAFDCYVKRFGNHGEVSNEDISTVDKTKIPDHSLLVGGFPCQDYSVARSKVNEKGIEGKKGVLFWQIVEILEKKKTPFVLLENVDRLLKSPATQRGRDFGIMLRTLSDLGYNVEWRVINAADYGAAQRRRRVFIFAWRRELKYGNRFSDSLDVITKSGLFGSTFPIELSTAEAIKGNPLDINALKDTVEMTSKFQHPFANAGILLNGLVSTYHVNPVIEEPITIRQIQDKTQDLSRYFINEKQRFQFEFLKNGKRIERVKPNGEPYFYSEGGMMFPDSIDLPGRTMLTSEASINRSTHVITDHATGKLRFITPLEAERMQHFPDNWTDSGMPENRRYFMMGNALVTKVINRLEKRISSIIENQF